MQHIKGYSASFWIEKVAASRQNKARLRIYARNEKDLLRVLESAGLEAVICPSRGTGFLSAAVTCEIAPTQWTQMEKAIYSAPVSKVTKVEQPQPLTEKASQRPESKSAYQVSVYSLRQGYLRLY